MSVGQDNSRPELTQQYIAILRHDPCAYCGAPASANPRGESHIDHIHPVYRGGADRGVNMTAACRRCNSSKSTKTLLGFLAWRIYDEERREAQAVLSYYQAFGKVGL